MTATMTRTATRNQNHPAPKIPPRLTSLLSYHVFCMFIHGEEFQQEMKLARAEATRRAADDAEFEVGACLHDIAPAVLKARLDELLGEWGETHSEFADEALSSGLFDDPKMKRHIDYLETLVCTAADQIDTDQIAKALADLDPAWWGLKAGPVKPSDTGYPRVRFPHRLATRN